MPHTLVGMTSRDETAQDSFRSLIQTRIAPALRELGRGQVRAFQLPSSATRVGLTPPFAPAWSIATGATRPVHSLAAVVAAPSKTQRGEGVRVKPAAALRWAASKRLSAIIAVALVATAQSAAAIAASGGGLDTTTTLVTDANPLAEGRSAHLTASTKTADGSPLPRGTLTIRNEDTATVVASGPIQDLDNSVSTWVAGLSIGDHRFSATYTSTAGGNPSSATLVQQVTDQTPPLTRITSGPSSWMPFPDQTITFEVLYGGVSSECRFDGGQYQSCTSPWEASGLPDGRHTFEVRSMDAAGNVEPSPALVEWTIDTTPPTGSVTINGGATWTNDPLVRVLAPGFDRGYPVWTVLLSNSPALNEHGFLANALEFRGYDPAKPLLWSLDDARYGGDANRGVKNVYAQWQDSPLGHWSAVEKDTIAYETVPPTVTAPAPQVVVPSTASTVRVPVRISWTGYDATSGIATYQLEQSYEDGAYNRVPLSTSTQTTFAAWLWPGNIYRFRVRAVDRAGNVSAWAYGPRFLLVGHQESSSDIRYAGAWRLGSASWAYGGALRYASAAGATATLRFSGRGIAWITTMSSTRGTAGVYVDGAYAKTVSTYSAAARYRQIVFQKTWATSGTHTITIRVGGTAGHPRVDLDALIVVL